MKPQQWRGDDGTTPLNPPEVFVPKDSPVIFCLGAMQELSAALGVARSLIKEPSLSELDDMLRETQRHLYVVKCDFASISEEVVINGKKIPRPSDEDVLKVDEHVQLLETKLGNKPDRFILECGDPAAAAVFMANEVARRAERLLISLEATITEQGDSLIPKIKACQQYLNHLSYQLYLMARVINRTLGVPEESISTNGLTGEVTVVADRGN